MAAFGLYSHIRANRIRSVLLIGGLFFLVYALAFAGALAGEALTYNAPFEIILHRAFISFIPSIPVTTLMTLAWIGISYLFHQKILGVITGSHRVKRTEMPELYALLENLCISRGMRTPHLSIMETDALNAYASGLSDNQYTVTVTRGLIETLNRDELEAVLAHELTHIRNKDVQLMVTAMIIAGVISFFGELLLRCMQSGPVRSRRSSSSDSNQKNGGAALALLIALAIAMLAWVLSIIIRFSLSRSREYLADAGAVELTKNPDAMISALLKISGNSEVSRAPSAVMEMCIDNPRRGFSSLFATHPSIEKRIKALVCHAGGRLSSSHEHNWGASTGVADQEAPGPWENSLPQERTTRTRPWNISPQKGPWV